MYRGKEKRRFERFNMETKVNFCLYYDLRTRVKFEVLSRRNGKPKIKKYTGISRNISAQGLRFCSEIKLKKGDRLFIEVYLPGRLLPIPMTGVVRWSKRFVGVRKEKFKFNTGVQLKSIKGEPVAGSIHMDNKYHVPWSEVLESVFGGFRKFLRKQRRPV